MGFDKFDSKMKMLRTCHNLLASVRYSTLLCSNLLLINQFDLVTIVDHWRHLARSLKQNPRKFHYFESEPEMKNHKVIKHDVTIH